jgi:hypothetical protein
MAAYKYIEIRDKVKALYLQGYTKIGIAEMLGVDPNIVGYILYVQLKMHLGEAKKPRYTNLVEEMPRQIVNRVITLTNFGYNSREISEDLNLPNCRINRLIQEAKSKNLIKKMV